MWSLLKDLLSFVLPAFCPICKTPLGEGESIVCEDCFQQMPLIAAPFCQSCGSPLKGEGVYCRRCREGDSPLRRGRGVGVYGGVLLELIQLLKYKRKPSLARRLGSLMAEIALSDPMMSQADLVVPVPLYRTRLRERGYNQAELLAREVSESMGVGLSARSLVRRKATRTQTLLSEEERRENVRDAFLVVKEKEVKGRKVILVDDVLTTGATLRSAASALLESGAAEVYGLVSAIAPSLSS